MKIYATNDTALEEKYVCLAFCKLQAKQKPDNSDPYKKG